MVRTPLGKSIIGWKWVLKKKIPKVLKSHTTNEVTTFRYDISASNESTMIAFNSREGGDSPVGNNVWYIVVYFL